MQDEINGGDDDGHGEYDSDDKADGYSGDGATFSRSINDIIRPAQTSLTIAKKVENTSPPLFLYGRKIKSDATTAPSMMTIAMA